MARDEAVSWRIKRRVVADEDRGKWTRVVLPHPADTAPRPTSSELQTIIRDAEGRILDGFPADYDIGGGCIVMDGSCSRHIIKELNRAAWCVSLYDKGSDKCRATISGPVWDPLPQTPQASEHVAMAIAADLVTQEALPVSDCLGVVRLANSAPEQQLKATFKYAGIRRHAMAKPGLGF